MAPWWHGAPGRARPRQQQPELGPGLAAPTGAWPRGAGGSFGSPSKGLVSDKANCHKEGGTLLKRCSCPKYLTREVKEKLSCNSYPRPDVAMAGAMPGSCSTSAISLPRIIDTGLGGCNRPLPQGEPPGTRPPELGPAWLWPGQHHPVRSREPPGAVTRWLDGDASLSPRSESLLLFPLPAPRGVREGRPGRVRV